MSKILTLYKRRTSSDPRAESILRLIQRNGYPQLKTLDIEKVLRVEKAGIDLQQIGLLLRIFCHMSADRMSLTSVFNTDNNTVIEISYQRAWTDPEFDSIMHAANSLGVSGIEWVRLSTRYMFGGVSERVAKDIAKKFLYNSQSQAIINSMQPWSTLQPQGVVTAIEKIDIANMTDDELLKLSEKRRLFLSLEEMAVIRGFYDKTEKREIRDGELEMLAAAWSEHCNHTTLKSLGLLQSLQKDTAKINHPLVISAYDDNAGVMDFYGDWALAIKGETHISPTSSYPYGGKGTEIGGVLRDPLSTGQGGYIIGATTLSGTCDPRMPWKDLPSGALHPLTILRESIQAISDYSNPMGIPMMSSQYSIDPGNVKCFTMGHALAILPKKRAKKGVPYVGDYVIVLGGRTGRDGIHGATVSSGAMTHKTIKIDSAHVQIGMPIEERCFMEVIPILRDLGCTRAITDCGAAGLSSAIGEMAAKVFKRIKKELITTSGVWINLAWLKLKCLAMRSWEKWLSESQERDVIFVPAHKLQLALETLDDYGVPAIVIGVITDSGRCQVVDDPTIKQSEWIKNPDFSLPEDDRIVVDLPYEFLSKAFPLPKIQIQKPKEILQKFSPQTPQNDKEWVELVKNVLGHYNISDQSVAAYQFDQTVQGATTLTYISGKDENMSDELFASTPVLGKPWTVGTAVSFNQFYGGVDPARAGQLVYAQAIARLIAAGFSPDDITCNVNIYTPRVGDNPEHAWRLVQLIEHGYGYGSTELGVPVISGKDSVNGTFEKDDGVLIHAPLTIVSLALGRMPRYQRLITKAFSKPGDKLVLYHPGLKEMNLGGSILLDLFDKRGDKLPKVDLFEARKGWVKYHEMLKKYKWSKHVHSRSVVAEGGLIRRLFEMSIGNGFGCKINLPEDPMNWLFSELNTAILFATSSQNCLEILGGNFTVIGEVINESEINVSVGNNKLFSVTTEELSIKWSKTFLEVAI